jgi:predicted nucleic acid-binding protein
MGLILDSTVIVAAERAGQNAHRLMTSIDQRITETQIGVSVVTLIELAHGAARANSPERASRRRAFLDELLAAIPIYPVTAPIALRAGMIDGETQTRGVRIPLPDLLIGVIALELGYRVATLNLRDFERIPGLKVVKF